MKYWEIVADKVSAAGRWRLRTDSKLFHDPTKSQDDIGRSSQGFALGGPRAPLWIGF
jgi:hypothetical protein